MNTRQIPDETGHDVRLVVELDGGGSILLKVNQIVPIGARVLVTEHKSRLGQSKYAFAGVQ